MGGRNSLPKPAPNPGSGSNPLCHLPGCLVWVRTPLLSEPQFPFENGVQQYPCNGSWGALSSVQTCNRPREVPGFSSPPSEKQGAGLAALLHPKLVEALSSWRTAATAGERVPLPCPHPSSHPHLPHPRLVQCWPPGASCCFVSAPICTSRCSRKGCRLPGGARSTQWKRESFLPHLPPSTCLHIVSSGVAGKKKCSSKGL